MNARNKGEQAEDRVCEYLKKQGMRFVCRNYRTKFGEIDLIFHHREMLVFVEVRARSSRSFGGSISSVTRIKQQKIMKTAEHYLLKNGLQDKIPVRFDVVGLDGIAGQMHWIQQAFE